MTGAASGRAGREAARRRQRLEAILGFLGFFGVMTLIAAAAGIVRGEPSLLASAILLVIVGLGAWTWRVYRRL